MIKFLIGAFALQFAIPGCTRNDAVPRQDAAAWRTDLLFLGSELPRRHANAFHTVSRDDFAAAVQTLDAAIPTLNEDQSLVGLMGLVALIGDGHTHLDPDPDSPRYPLEFAWFGKELRIVAAATPHESLTGARVMGIGGVGVDSLMVLASHLVPRGENEGRTRLTATMLLGSARVIHGLGLSASRLQAQLAVQGIAGEEKIEPIRAMSPREIAGWRLAVERPPLWLRRLREPWWVEVLPEAKTVYLSFSRYPAQAEFEQRTRELVRLLDQSDARRLVIDLRLNQGGDLTRFRQILVPALKKHPGIDHPGGLFAIIGPGTFSAAMVNALDLRQELNATLVGEPTGARPNSYSEHGDFLLPRSRLRVSYSTRHYRFGADSDTAVEPYRRIQPTWDDFSAGRDPVMDWILAQPVK